MTSAGHPRPWNGQGINDTNLHGYSFPGIGNVYFADDQAMITQIIVPRHYTRVAVIQDNTPAQASNGPYMQGLASKYGYQVVASQIVNPGATNDTPQVLNLLKANPQVIVLGLTPGPDTITFLKSMRAQNPTIPIGECSGCAMSQFVSAVGGPKTMSNIYLIGTPENVLASVLRPARPAMRHRRHQGVHRGDEGSGPGHGGPDRRGERLGHRAELADDLGGQSPSSARRREKRALQKQKLTVGGIVMYQWTRSSSDGSFDVLRT